MSSQQAAAAKPFVDDPDFRRAVMASIGGLLLGLVATGLTFAFGPVAAVSYLAAAALLVWAALAGRRSSTRSRELFATRLEWKLAERNAVATVLIKPRLLRTRG